MLRAVADTHSAIWYLFGDRRLSPTARTWFDEAAASGQGIGLSTVSLAEIVYLIEKGRIHPGTFRRAEGALEDPESVLSPVPLDLAVVRAMREVSRAEVADFPDRIIAATAVSRSVPLISRDGKIRLSKVATIW